MNYAGIDWSMTSPGLVIGNSPNPDDLLYYGIRQKKKQVSKAANIILLEPNDSYFSNIERYDTLARTYVDILKRHNVTQVWAEGYAYGATGNTFNIGECTGMLKYHLWKAGINLDILQPGEIKKFATGKGNANKTLMYQAYINKTGHRLDQLIDDEVKGDKIPSPVNDLVDSYYALLTGLSTTRLEDSPLNGVLDNK